MTDNRLGGGAMIIGAVAALVTMSIHPTGGDLLAPGRLSSMTLLAGVAHGLAIASLPVAFLGALALTRYLDSPLRLAAGAVLAYGFALCAVMAAAAVSGFVAPPLLRRVVTEAPPMTDEWRLLVIYTGLLNRAFAMIFVMLSSGAVMLWSLAIVRTGALAKSVGLYGVVIAPIIVIAVGSGHIALDVHGFGAVILLQAIWFISAGTSLWRATDR
jgi:hypothetical protein